MSARIVNARRFVLRVLEGALTGRSFPVVSEVIIGRSEGSDISIADRKLSRRHAQVRLEDGRLVLRDLDSQHGTFINGIRIASSELRGGDVIDVGGSRLRVDVHRGDDARPVELVRDPERLRATIVKEVNPKEPPNFDARNFAILYDIAQAIQAERDSAKMLSSVVDRVLDSVYGDRAYVALLNDGGALIPKSVRYRDATLVPAGTDRVALSRTVADRVLGQRCGLISADTAQDDRFATSDTVLLSDVHALMAVPLIVGDRVTGLFEVEVYAPDVHLSEQDLDLLSVVASMLAVALENLELDRMREETIRELERAQEELLATQARLVRSEQMAVIGRLASGIAHEVKNHLSPFMLADMIARRYPDDAEIAEAAQMMLEAQKHIYGLVDEIRLFAQGARAEYDMAPHDLGHVVEGVLRFLACDSKVKRTSIELLREGEPLVEIDAGRIRQVLINLIRNAADALDGERGHIRVCVRESGDAAIIDVTDDGKGIPADVADRVFEPFFSTKGANGLGLGLDISRKIVLAHGGTLTFESELGSGSTFRILLPIRP